MRTTTRMITAMATITTDMAPMIIPIQPTGACGPACRAA
jgi:hypothetical protein